MMRASRVIAQFLSIWYPIPSGPGVDEELFFCTNRRRRGSVILATGRVLMFVIGVIKAAVVYVMSFRGSFQRDSKVSLACWAVKFGLTSFLLSFRMLSKNFQLFCVYRRTAFLVSISRFFRLVLFPASLRSCNTKFRSLRSCSFALLSASCLISFVSDLSCLFNLVIFLSGRKLRPDYDLLAVC